MSLLPSLRRLAREPQQLVRRLRLETLEQRQLLAGDVGGEILRLGGTVTGTKWEDLDQDGRRDRNEPGLPGVLIYADVNHNGQRDEAEPAVRTQPDNPLTRADEAGQYRLAGLPTGEYQIREVVPEGFQQTFPRRAVDVDRDAFATVHPSAIDVKAEPGEPIEQAVSITVHPLCIRPFEFEVQAMDQEGAPVPGVEFINHSDVQVNGCGGDESEFKVELLLIEPGPHAFDLAFVDQLDGDVHARIPVTINAPRGHGHPVSIRPGTQLSGRHFGNARVEPATGAIEGRKWLDRNGDGAQDPDEPGLGGVTVYLDLNNNAQLDRHEPRTQTQYEDPVTDFDEGGRYSFAQLRPGSYLVREVVPEGYAPTYPAWEASVLASETGRFAAGAALDLDVTAAQYEAPSAASSEANLELTVVWRDGCGELLTDQTAHAVVGNTILVDLHGTQVGDICTDALKPQQTEVEIPGLKPGDYQVVATLHEGESAEATLALVGEVRLGPVGGHRVEVEAGSTVAEVDFGNRRLGQRESIQGTKWHDVNGDGRRQRDEPGLAGVTVYVDLDGSGSWNEGEPRTVTADGEQLGTYRFELEPGRYTVREVVPDGYRQTFPPTWDFPTPEPLPEPWPDLFSPGGAHHVELGPGAHLEGLDFGNQSNEPGMVRGWKWQDADGNRRPDDGEPGLAGVTIYADLNRNGQLDADEPSTVTQADDETTADVDETGRYELSLRPGNHLIREVVPEGFEQTFPRISFPIWPIEFVGPRPGVPIFWQPGGHFVDVQPGVSVEGFDFGNRQTEPGSIRGLKWQDDNGNGRREPGEPGLAGVTIYADLNHNRRLDEGEPRTVTQQDDPATTDSEAGHYWLDGLQPNTSYAIREIVPEGFRQTFPASPWFRPPIQIGPPVVEPGVPPLADLLPHPDQHVVFLSSGQHVAGRDFGNQPVRDPGHVMGTVWNDGNGNGQREDNERGLAGVVVFADQNLNGEWDRGEPQSVSRADNPETPKNEAGQYQLSVPPGPALILQVLPAGMEQVFPSPLREVIFPYNLGHNVDVASGQTTTAVDFGNRQLPSPSSVISGRVWMDDNGNGVVDRGEGGHAGSVVYLDLNNDGRWNAPEPRTTTGNPPQTLEDFHISPRLGAYAFAVKPGDYTVRQIVPRHYAQTYPFANIVHGEAEAEDLPGGTATGLEIVDFSIGTTSPTDDGQSPVLATFETRWPDGGWQIEEVDVVRNRDEVQVVLLATPTDATRASGVERTTVNLGALPLGGYGLQVTLVEQDPQQEPAGDVKSMQLQTKFALRGDDAHRVRVAEDEHVSGQDFGLIATPRRPDEADAALGEDPHGDHWDENATTVSFDAGQLILNSFVDHDGDVDVFRFAGLGGSVEGEGGRMDAGDQIQFELLDASGAVVAEALAGQPLQADTAAGQMYYVRVSGAQGQYRLDLFGSEPEQTNNPDRLAGDVDGDGQVVFADFLILSANFGQEVDAAFAGGDLTGDARVTFEDFLLLAANFA